MRELLEIIENVRDMRQKKKCLHKVVDCVAIVLFATLANADDWVEREIFAKAHEDFLREYLELPHGVPSHDTLQRVIAMISPSVFENLLQQFNKKMNTGEGEKIRKILAIDGKTERGNGNCNQKANHIVSAVDEDGFCLGQELVQEKSNEIPAIPILLDKINIENCIATTDALGTQAEIAKKIMDKKADYVLALKGNQHNFYEDVTMWFGDFVEKCQYTYKVEKARGGVEKREYWQTSDISWLETNKKWTGLKSIGMTKNTISKNGTETSETRYFISSLEADVEQFARAVRKHWLVETFHWHLDVTLREDRDKTLDKQLAYNMNIIRKIALTILKIADLGLEKRSLKKRRYAICTNPESFLRKILES